MSQIVEIKVPDIGGHENVDVIDVAVKAGDTINVPGIGDCSVITNDKLVAGDTTADTNNGVVLLPERVEFTKDNIADYNF